MKKQRKRDEIEEKYKWDLTKIYKNIDEFNKDFQKSLSSLFSVNTNFPFNINEINTVIINAIKLLICSCICNR